MSKRKLIIFISFAFCVINCFENFALPFQKVYANYMYVPKKNNKKYDYIDNSTTDYYYTGTSCGNENKPEYNKSVKKPQVYSGGRWVKRTNWHDNAWKPKYMEDWYYYPAGSTESL